MKDWQKKIFVKWNCESWRWQEWWVVWFSFAWKLRCRPVIVVALKAKTTDWNHRSLRQRLYKRKSELRRVKTGRATSASARNCFQRTLNQNYFTKLIVWRNVIFLSYWKQNGAIIKNRTSVSPKDPTWRTGNRLRGKRACHEMKRNMATVSVLHVCSIHDYTDRQKVEL